jgi:hypothetical protein
VEITDAIFPEGEASLGKDQVLTSGVRKTRGTGVVMGLNCDSSEHSDVNYAELFFVFGSSYGIFIFVFVGGRTYDCADFRGFFPLSIVVFTLF